MKNNNTLKMKDHDLHFIVSQKNEYFTNFFCEQYSIYQAVVVFIMTRLVVWQYLGRLEIFILYTFKYKPLGGIPYFDLRLTKPPTPLYLIIIKILILG